MPARGRRPCVTINRVTPSELVRAAFDRYAPVLDSALRAAAPDGHPLYQLVTYHLGWTDEHGVAVTADPGKRLRPTLCLLIGEALGCSVPRLLPAAVAIELLHNFSLIHDDIQDASLERRHRPTVWSVWGTAQGINAGDALHVLAQRALLGLRDAGVAGATVLDAMVLFEEASQRLCEGQYLDLAFEGRPDIGIAGYLDMIEGKTASLFGASLEMGALLAGSTPERRQRCRAAGRALGFAFQLQDDVLGTWGLRDETGKSASADLDQRKSTFPLVHTCANAGEADRERLLCLYRQPALSLEEQAWVRRLLEATEARAQTEKVARRYLEDALALLNSLDGRRDLLDQLEAAVLSVVDRDR